MKLQWASWRMHSLRRSWSRFIVRVVVSLTCKNFLTTIVCWSRTCHMRHICVLELSSETAAYEVLEVSSKFWSLSFFYAPSAVCVINSAFYRTLVSLRLCTFSSVWRYGDVQLDSGLKFFMPHVFHHHCFWHVFCSKRNTKDVIRRFQAVQSQSILSLALIRGLRLFLCNVVWSQVVTIHNMLCNT